MEIRAVLYDIQQSIELLKPELVLTAGMITVLISGLFKPAKHALPLTIACLTFLSTAILIMFESKESISFFGAMLHKTSFSDYLKIILNFSAFCTCVMARKRSQVRLYLSEFSALLIAIVWGGHFLLMSSNLLLLFLSMELVSISSYVLAGFAFNRQGSEGSLKFFLFGSVASAIMLYGFSILYGLTGTLNFTTENFVSGLLASDGSILLVAGAMSLTGLLFKISAAPMHAWAPDVYEAAPIPVIAFLSVVPKLAGLGILVKFLLMINVYGQSVNDWQIIISIVSMLTITVGNFAALSQKNPKRMMGYSSIAQSGFLLIGVAAFLPQGLHFMLFYSTVYAMMNFVVFIYLAYFEERGISMIAGFSGVGKQMAFPSILLLIGLIALTGLPPTSGFTGKLFLFSSLWQSYELSGKTILLWLMIFGLLNTVISLFYYLKIPYYAFMKGGSSSESQYPPPNGQSFSKKENFITIENLLGIILVSLILALFFAPGLLMGWINKVNFVF